jgi:hypothetical protein
LAAGWRKLAEVGGLLYGFSYFTGISENATGVGLATEGLFWVVLCTHFFWGLGFPVFLYFSANFRQFTANLILIFRRPGAGFTVALYSGADLCVGMPHH